MNFKHLIVAVMLGLSLSATSSFSQTIDVTPSPLGAAVKTFTLTPASCTIPTTAPCSTAYFILYGDGHFDAGTGTGTGLTLIRTHKYPDPVTPSTYTAKAWFAEKKDVDPPGMLSSPVTAGSGGSFTNPITPMSSNIQVSTSWIPVKKQGHFVILTIRNECTSTQNGQINFYFNDSKVSFDPSQFLTYNPHAPISAVGTISNSPSIADCNKVWPLNYNNLLPGTQRHIFLWATVKINIAPGVAIPYFTTITPGCGDSPNSFGYTAIAGAAAHDPNRKTVNIETLCPNSAAAPLQYKVFFQNDGDGPATNIMVRDEIDVTQLNLSPLTLTSPSPFCPPPYLDPGNPNAYIFDFQGINLPGINQTAPYHYAYSETVGEFTFNIETLPNLSPGSVIPNMAEVYFDGAGPVATNVAEVAILDDTEENPCLIPDRTESQNNRKSTGLVASATPSPFSDNLKITPKALPIGETANVQIFDPSGRMLAQQTFFDDTEWVLQTEAWAAGIFFVRIQTKRETSVQRVIKQ